MKNNDRRTPAPRKDEQSAEQSSNQNSNQSKNCK